MSRIEWKEEFSLGIAGVDLEHRELIATINALQGEISEGSDCSNVLPALGEIFALISAHFALEEKVMRQANYPHYKEHKIDHEALLDQLRDMMDSVEDSREFEADKLSTALSQWFSVHFQTHDAKLHLQYPDA